jgi:K(+)-stimulated pyrophosphate-energized sodium pump
MLSIFWIVPIASILALGFALYFYRQVYREDEGTEIMKKIANHVRLGAMAYLRQQYKVVLMFFCGAHYFICHLSLRV